MFRISAGTAVNLFDLTSRRFLNRACGLVGYPNVGKSTLFNAITQTQLAAAENYPFCTIDPNISKVAVPDKILNDLAAKVGSKKTIPGQIEVRDIAGIIKGAGNGAGMGNQFLSNIRGVNAILQVVRCFEDSRIAHVEDSLHLDPVGEFESVATELLLSDLELAQKRVPALKRKALNDKLAAEQYPVFEKCLQLLSDGIAPRSVLNEEEKVIAEKLDLITAKPLLVVCNVEAEAAATGNSLSEKLIAHVRKQGLSHIILCAQLEFEACMLANDGDAEFARETLAAYGLTEPALPRVASKAKELLRVKSFYTLGEQEARAWFVPHNAKAPESGSAIHTDFKEGFTGAHVTRWEDVMEVGLTEAQSKRVRKANKEYMVIEGDVIEFMDPKKTKK